MIFKEMLDFISYCVHIYVITVKLSTLQKVDSSTKNPAHKYNKAVDQLIAGPILFF